MPEISMNISLCQWLNGIIAIIPRFLESCLGADEKSEIWLEAPKY